MDLSTVLVFAMIVAAVRGVWLVRDSQAPPPVVDPLAGTETWTVEEIEALRQGSEEVGTRLRRQVGVVAATGPNPSGALTTPDGGIECVWWRIETIRHYVETVDGERLDRTERVSHNWSRDTFTLTDETGTLVVNPADMEVVGAPQVYTRTEKVEPEGTGSALSRLLEQDSTTAMTTMEHALPVGTTVFVHGEAHDWDPTHVTIRKPLDGGPFILSTKHERTLRENAEEQRTNTEMMRWQGYGLIALAAALLVVFYMM